MYSPENQFFLVMGAMIWLDRYPNNVGMAVSFRPRLGRSNQSRVHAAGIGRLGQQLPKVLLGADPVHAGIERHHLQRRQSLVVVHRHHGVVVAAIGVVEKRVGAERPGDIDPAPLRRPARPGR